MPNTVNVTGKQAYFSAETVPDLISRLEKAAGPDRGIDARIWLACEPCELPDCFSDAKQRIADRIISGSGDDGECPPYTSSIDAALTLVPPTYTTSVHSDRPETFPTGWSIDQLCDSEFQAEITYFPTWNVEPPTLGEGYAISPAIALCIAALKARSAA